MAGTDLEGELRPAHLDDASAVAELESMRDPSEPRDPVLLRYWWQMSDELESVMRRVSVSDGAAVAFVGASHVPWEGAGDRYGVVRPLLSYQRWRDDDYATLVGIGERWLRSEGAETSVARVREDFPRDLAVLDRLGFREQRRMRTSELDLVARRDHILESARECAARMEAQGVELRVMGEDSEAGRFEQLYETMVESRHDIPTSMPERHMTFDEWRRYWFDNPAIREDRFWIARVDGDIVGCSVLDCPVVRGIPWTAYTGTRRSVRGRGIARALKYQSMAQAIEVGYTRVRTNNDADNPPILRINEEMGYQLIAPVIELHHGL